MWSAPIWSTTLGNFAGLLRNPFPAGLEFQCFLSHKLISSKLIEYSLGVVPGYVEIQEITLGDDLVLRVAKISQDHILQIDQPTGSKSNRYLCSDIRR